MLRRIGLLALAVILAVSGFGCAPERSAEEATVATLVKEPEQVSVSLNETAGDRTLKMDVQVTIPDLETLETVKLAFDEELLDTMVEELAKSRFPDIQEEEVGGYRDWSVQNEEQLLFVLSCEDTGFDAGWTYYEDVADELNGQAIGEDDLKWWIPHYLTEHIPNQMGLSAAEAAKEIGDFLARYSCFAYEPWSVAAFNCKNDPNISGYYSARMQPYYDDLPVYGEQQMKISAHMSAEGVFGFQGVLLLKEQERAAIQQAMPLDAAVEQFQKDFAAGAIEGSVTVDRINIGYIARSGYQGNYTLSPAWVFECTELPENTEGANSTTDYHTYAYLLETGKLRRVE